MLLELSESSALRDSWHRIRQMVPMLLLVLYLLLATLGFYFLQKNYTYANVNDAPWDVRGSNHTHPDSTLSVCVDARPHHDDSPSVMLAFYYVTTLHTTIGYGDVYPCTLPGKLLTCVASILGVPLTLLCVSILGRAMANGGAKLWGRIPPVFTRTAKIQEVPDPEGSPPELLDAAARPRLPVSVGLLVTIVYLLLFSLYMYKIVLDSIKPDDEHMWNNWIYFDAVYFTVTSMLTIGLGDYSPRDKFLYPVTFCLIFFGVTLVSMCVQLVIRSMESQFEKVVHLIQELYDAQQDQDTETTEVESADELNPTERRVAKVILELWKTDPQGRWMIPLMNQDGAAGSRNNSALKPKPPRSPQLSANAQRLFVNRWRLNCKHRTIGTQTTTTDANPADVSQVTYSNVVDVSPAKPQVRIKFADAASKYAMPSSNHNHTSMIRPKPEQQQQQQQQRQKDDSSNRKSESENRRHRLPSIVDFQPRPLL